MSKAKRALKAVVLAALFILLMVQNALAASRLDLTSIQTDVTDTLTANWSIILGVVGLLVVPVVVYRFARRFIK